MTKWISGLLCRLGYHRDARLYEAVPVGWAGWVAHLHCQQCGKEFVEEWD